MGEDLIRTTETKVRIRLNTCRVIGKLADLNTLGCVINSVGTSCYFDVPFQSSILAIVRIRFIVEKPIFWVTGCNYNIETYYLSFKPAVGYRHSFDPALVNFFVTKGHYSLCMENDNRDAYLYRL